MHIPLSPKKSTSADSATTQCSRVGISRLVDHHRRHACENVSLAGLWLGIRDRRATLRRLAITSCCRVNFVKKFLGNRLGDMDRGEHIRDRRLGTFHHCSGRYKSYWTRPEDAMCKLVDLPGYRPRLEIQFVADLSVWGEKPDLNMYLPRFDSLSRERVGLSF